jgi:hypothetical protein
VLHPRLKNIALILGLFLSIWCASVHADEHSIGDESGLVQFSTRVFDLQADLSTFKYTYSRLPFMRVPWIDDYFDNDPIYNGMVIQLRAGNVSQQKHFPPFYWQDRQLAQDVPSAFFVSGYDIYEKGLGASDFLYIPKSNPKDGYATCARQTKNPEKILGCTLRFKYYADPQIVVIVRWYSPETVRDFQEVGNRIRAFIHCLDVTDEVASRTYKKRLPDDPEYRKTEGCQLGLRS